MVQFGVVDVNKKGNKMTTTYEVKQATLDVALWFELNGIAYNAIVNEDYDIHTSVRFKLKQLNERYKKQYCLLESATEQLAIKNVLDVLYACECDKENEREINEFIETHLVTADIFEVVLLSKAAQ